MIKPLSRRAVLRGVGAALALPWLECMMPRGRATGGQTRRLVVWHVPNGMVMDTWTPQGQGLSWTASPILTPLDGLRASLTIPTGLNNSHTDEVEPHDGRSLGLLSGRDSLPWAVPDPAGWTTMDQVAADGLGATPIRSLELGSESATPCGEAAAGQVPTCAGYQTISWRDATPLPRTIHPRQVLDRLFGISHEGGSVADRARKTAREQRIVDLVREDANRLNARLGAADRARFDGFLTGVDELDRRLQEAPLPADDPCALAAATLDATYALDAPMDIDTHVEVMTELMVLALQCDRTRVISYMLGNERSNRPYPRIGVPESHHVISHHSGDPAKLDKLTAIGTWEVQMWARLLSRMAAVPEADGTLLDSAAVLFCAGLSDPMVHDMVNLPVLLAGRACGGLVPAGRVDYAEGSQIADLHLTVLRALGIPLDRFGDLGLVGLAGLG